jgi:flagellar biosynthesis protein FlhF
VQYQTFRGADVQEALSSVKAALGPNAVIESTRHVSNGRRGGFNQSFVEVTATSPKGATGAWPFSADLIQPPATYPRNSKTRGIQTPISREPMHAAETSSPKWTAEPVVLELEREMVALRTMLEELNSRRSPKERALAMLNAAGLNGRVAKEIAHNLGKSARSLSAMRGLLAERLRSRIRVIPSPIAQPTRQMIACVGPTGAGKTTTLAKLAAQARLDYGRSVAVISLDTYRVGAIEQWQRYARLIGTAFAVARNVDDFERVLSSITAELVLVDTAGRNCADTDETWPLVDCLPKVARHELNVLVVLPAFLRAKDAEQVIRTYADVRPSAAVITKLDETQESGGVLQATIEGEMPIAYTCEGPRVPEDIRNADTELLIQGLLPPDA